MVKVGASRPDAPALTFTHDRVALVHVHLQVKDVPAWKWMVTGKLAIEIGSLDKLAKGCRGIL